jgi:hypothetical protein
LRFLRTRQDPPIAASATFLRDTSPRFTNDRILIAATGAVGADPSDRGIIFSKLPA